jgi:hypothetical protein
MTESIGATTIAPIVRCMEIQTMNWDLIVGWVAIITFVIAIRRLNAGNENMPPLEDDG